MKRFIALITVLVFLVASVVGCSTPVTPTTSAKPTTPATSAAPAPIHLKWATWFGAASDAGKACDAGMTLVEQRSNGRIVFDKYWAGSLVLTADVVKALKENLVDFSYIPHQDHPQECPLSSVTSFRGVIYNSWSGMMAWQEFKNNPTVKGEFAASNMISVWPTTFYPANIFTTKTPARTISDLKGMRLDAPPGGSELIAQKIGAVPVWVTNAELYDSLSKGTIDGAIWNVEYMGLYTLQDVCKYWMSDANASGMVYSLCFNLKTFNTLPKDIQDIILNVGNEFSDINYETCHGAPVKKFIEEVMPKSGVQRINWSAADIATFTAAVVSAGNDQIQKLETQYPNQGKALFQTWKDLYTKYDAQYDAHATAKAWPADWKK